MSLRLPGQHAVGASFSDVDISAFTMPSAQPPLPWRERKKNLDGAAPEDKRVELHKWIEEDSRYRRDNGIIFNDDQKREWNSFIAKESMDIQGHSGLANTVSFIDEVYFGEKGVYPILLTPLSKLGELVLVKPIEGALLRDAKDGDLGKGAAVGIGSLQGMLSMGNMLPTVRQVAWDVVADLTGTSETDRFREIKDEYIERISLGQYAPKDEDWDVTDDFASAVGSAAAQLPIQLLVGAAGTMIGGPKAGLWAASLFGGSQSFSDTYGTAFIAYRARGFNNEEAYRKAMLPSLTSFGITSLVTRAFGFSGVEKFWGAGAKTFLGEKAGSLAAKAGIAEFVKKVSWGGIVPEAMEEGLDTVLQKTLEYNSFNPDLTFEDALQETIMAMLVGGIMGGAANGAMKIPGFAFNSKGEAEPRTKEVFDDTGTEAEVEGDLLADYGLRPTQEEAAEHLSNAYPLAKARHTARAAGSDADAAYNQALNSVSKKVADGEYTLAGATKALPKAIHNAALDIAGKDKGNVSLEGQQEQGFDPASERTVEEEVHLNEIRETVAKLPNEQRVVAEGILDKKSVNQIAKETGMTRHEVGKQIKAMAKSMKNFGPGAASSAQWDATHRLLDRLVEMDHIDPDLVAGQLREVFFITPEGQTSETSTKRRQSITNEQTRDEVKKIIDEADNLDDIARQVKDPSSKLTPAQRGVAGVALIEKWNQEYSKLKKEGNEDAAQEVADKWFEFSQDFAELATGYGQFIQTLSLMGRMNPDLSMRYVQREISKVAKKVSGKISKRKVSKIISEVKGEIKVTESDAQKIINAEADKLSEVMDWPSKPKQNELKALYRSHVKEPIADFAAKAKALGATDTEAKLLNDLALEQNRRLLINKADKAKAAIIKRLKKRIANAPDDKFYDRLFDVLMKAQAEGVLGDKEFRAAFEEAIATSPEAIQRIVDETSRLAHVPLDQKRESQEERDIRMRVEQEVRKLQGADIKGSLIEMWYSNILFRLGTNAINVLGTVVSSASWWLPYQIYAAASTRSKDAAARSVQAIWDSSPQAMRDFKKEFQGYSVLKGVRFAPKATALDIMAQLEPKNPVEWALHKAAWVRYSLRVLRGTDSVFNRIMHDSMVEAEVARTGFNETFDAKEAAAEAERVVDAVGLYNDLKDIKGRPASEAAKAKDRQDRINTRIYEMRRESLPDEVVAFSERMASLSTLTNPPEGFFAGVSKTITTGQKEITFMGAPVFQAKVPFVNIVLNLGDFMIGFAGYDLARAAAGKHPSQYFSAEADTFSPQERAMRAIRGATGLILGHALYMMAMGGIDDDEPLLEVTFLGPSSKAKRDQLRQTKGWRRTSVRVNGGKWMPYQDIPVVSAWLAGVGKISDSHRYEKDGKYDGVDAEVFQTMLGTMFVSVLFSTPIKGVNDMMSGLFGGKYSEGEYDAKDMAQEVLAMGKGLVPAAGLWAEADKLLDPQVYTQDSRTMLAALLADLPYTDRFLTRPILNVFGEPVENSMLDRLPVLNRFLKNDEPDPRYADQYRYLADVKILIPRMKQTLNKVEKLSVPDHITRLADESFTDEDVYEIQKIYGPMVLEEVTDAMNGEWKSEEELKMLNRRLLQRRQQAILEYVRNLRE